VEANAFDGAGWKTVWDSQSREAIAFATETFSWSSQSSEDTTFVTETVSLADYIGREIDLRFAAVPIRYDIQIRTVGGPPFPTWYVDDIVVVGGRRFSEVSSAKSQAGMINWRPESPGRYRLALSNIHFDENEGPTGPSAEVTFGDLPAPVAKGFLNISTRVTAGTGDKTLILGYVLTGATSGEVLVRAVGPALKGFGVSDAATAASIDIYSGNVKTLAQNGWAASLAARFTAFGAFPLGAGDSAVERTLNPGAYTMMVQSAGGQVLGEVFTQGSSSARMTNLSARFYLPDGETGIVGVVVAAEQTILFRALGPGLQVYGVSGTMPQPRVTLYNSVGQAVATNTNWTTANNATSIEAFSASVGAAPFDRTKADSGLLVVLAPGAYTMHVTGADGKGGVVLVDGFTGR